MLSMGAFALEEKHRTFEFFRCYSIKNTLICGLFPCKRNCMKTDSIEIFQTIRAAMQPYTALGFTARANTDDNYDLWSEKNVLVEGKKKTELHFAEVKVSKNDVQFCVYAIDLMGDKRQSVIDQSLSAYQDGDTSCFSIKQLDEALLENLTEVLERCYQLFKQKEWV